ncbi:synaptic vesicle glycoprotein 2C-like isoform X3 [Drosophila miranda]|uniref:synaptic vesicle glycoprotein 2C-like isoform X3 n=1 Tax=Drosophila miranda TaxID=7229 RepID=UPI00143F25EC|nr:synaptic vesicle glycoprotein 2C-like isoform X3 [Drosophila miranda]
MLRIILKYAHACLDFLEDFASDYENALLQTGFGNFQFLLITICGLIYMNTAMGVTIISFVLPSATCDFTMTSTDKGWLSASPMLGMLIGSYFWGCLADTKGRRVVLITTLLADGIFGILSSFAPIYIIFMLFRLVNGFNVAGTMSIIFPYLGEFQTTQHREKILCWMELYWTFGIILLPGIAWSLIPLKINIGSGIISYHSWNLFVALCAVPSILLGLWLFAFPESPKFLLEHGESEKALEVLTLIYVKNTGQSRSNYPCTTLRESIRPLQRDGETNIQNQRIGNFIELKNLSVEIWDQTKTLYKHPYLKNSVITCAIQFCLTTSYYTLMVWFPEIFQRYDDYEKANPGIPASVCDISSIVTSNTKCVFNVLASYSIDGHPLLKQTEILDLGVLFDSRFLFSEHMKASTNFCRLRVGNRSYSVLSHIYNWFGLHTNKFLATTMCSQIGNQVLFGFQFDGSRICNFGFLFRSKFF